jgi:hypothetical protein
LVVSLNNNDWSHHFTNAFVNVGEWNQIVCSIDLGASVVQTYLNNRKLEAILLPPEFSLRVLESDQVDQEREVTLTNYSHGGTFRGYVDNLRVYAKCLDAATALALMPEHRPGMHKRLHLINWVTYGVVVLSLGVVIVTVLKRKEQDVGTAQ